MGESLPWRCRQYVQRNACKFVQNTLQYTPQDTIDTYVTFSLSVLTHVIISYINEIAVLLKAKPEKYTTHNKKGDRMDWSHLGQEPPSKTCY